MKNKKEKQPEFLTSAINSQVINYKVYCLSEKQKVLYYFILFTAGGLIAQIFYGGLFKDAGEATIATYISNIVFFLFGGLLAIKMMLPVLTERLRKQRLSLLKTQFRDFLSSLSAALSTGMNMNEAIENSYADLSSQYGEDSIIASEIEEIINCINNNVSIEEAILALGERSGIDDISNFSTVFAVSFETGGNIKDIVSRTSDIIVDKMLTNEEIETKLTSNKIQLYAMLVIPAVLMLLMRFMSSSFAESFATLIGVIAITIALALFFVAYKIGSKMLDVKG